MFYHHSVLEQEVVQSIAPALAPGGDETPYIADATVGMGGHSCALFSCHSSCIIHAVDADASMLGYARRRLKFHCDRVRFFHSWFDDFFSSCEHVYRAVIMDVGVCMYHFKESNRGFSRLENEPLDMRLNPGAQGMTAADVLNSYREDEIANVLFAYGEERASRVWAKKIVAYRTRTRIQTTADLLTALCLGKKPSDGKIITRVFQALRIEINDELGRIYRALPLAWNALKSGGRLAVISFHSLEDRIVKQFSRFVAAPLKSAEKTPIHTSSNRFLKNGCTAWHDIPMEAGICHTKRPVVPSDAEIKTHPESRSAKLRVVEKRTV